MTILSGHAVLTTSLVDPFP